MKLTPAQRTVLRSLLEHDGEGLAEVLMEFESKHFGAVKHEGSSFHLADQALSKVLDALKRRGLIQDTGDWAVTDAGKKALT